MTSHPPQEDSSSSAPGPDACKPLPLPNVEHLQIRQLLTALEEIIEDKKATYPTTAIGKFEDDLKESANEYTKIPEIVAKYEESFLKLDCALSTAKQNRDEIVEWCKEKNQHEDAIQTIWIKRYEGRDKEFLLAWVSAREQYYALQTCLWQTERCLEAAKQDLESIKGFDKWVKDQLTDLGGLYEKAKTARNAGYHLSVCAIKREYCKVLLGLTSERKSEDPRKLCALPQTEQQNQYQSSSSSSSPETASTCENWDLAEFAKKRDPKWFRQALRERLWALINSQYQRFLRSQSTQIAEKALTQAKDKLDKFRKTRREQFILEAQDIKETSDKK